MLDATDINVLTAAVRAEETSNPFDITADGLIDLSDRDQLIKVMMGTTLGDSNLDGQFDSTDFVFEFRAGVYGDDIDGNANWESGDWDGDFSTRDLVAAFREASYVREAVPVPEPSSCMLVDAGMIPLANWRMRRKRNPTC